ncbi:putative glycosyl hydrolase [Microbacterium barkeri]|uniref:Glycosyl hydrolase n=1 Tax=Microbacterium barkeri TaxID=33917 RepID=A0A9W6H5D1_9MICO|nr:glycoside hydrolase family 38 C-terminal domain-containing protein [Microbacterium barkeri]MDI6944597.1 glycoside hydrolase family 38 C-terminal domain-containing protein [Microbacterium barkeri]MDR6877192.1 alpha-mannosidase [Microbacterium barkeri]GLJ62613.1 putative glycosyl hydrolase [Microbacterium barkeri]
MTEVRQQDAATQVVRRLDRTRREVIVPGEIRASAPLSVAARAVGGEPVSFAEGTDGVFEPLEPGAAWGRAWDTVWMHVSGAVPDGWEVGSPERRGAVLELAVDLGFTAAQSGFQAEGLVYSPTGEVIRALSPLNHRIALDGEAGTPIEYWVEAAANPTLNTPDGIDLIPLSPLGDWDTAGDEPRYRFGGARLVLRDAEVSALRHDIDLLRGIAVAATTERRRRELVLAALERMLEALDPQDLTGTAAAARRALEPALAAPAHASAMTLTAVGHAHIDSAWLWPLRETVRKCARTFSNVVTLMEQNPDFVFACSSAQQFRWMKDFYPDLFARIRERVEAGQFVPVGGMWVESDTNMPSGESLARQFVAGQGFFRREFGITCEEVWLPDSFGYTGALPQIARSGGARWFFGQKMSWNRTNRMPHHTFEWEGIDGTRILTHFTPVDTYNSDLSPAELVYASENFEDHAGFGGGIVPFGYGDGGGGPTREMLEAGRRSADVEGLPRVAFGSPADFFATAEEEASGMRPPVWMGEMYLELHRGTYTSQSRTKRGNRRSEALLREAELWAATASVRTGAEYPAERLAELWERTLLLQFHDILPGSSISWVHRDAERLHAETHAELEGMIADAIATLVGEGDTELAANGSPFDRVGVPALGIAERGPADDARAIVAHEDGEVILRNEAAELRVAPDGTFSALVDRATGRSLFDGDTRGNALHLHHDVPTDWDAWDVDEHYRRQRIEVGDDAAVEELDGQRLRITRRFGASTVSQVVRMSARGDVDIETTVDWHERQRLLKLAFPFLVDARHSTAETQFGSVARPIHENTSWDAARFEIVAHRWMHVDDGRTGVAVVNDSTYGHDVTRLPLPGSSRYATQVRQTLLRSPLYPDPESDQGTHVFRSRIVVGSTSDAVEAAYDLDSAIRTVRGRSGVEPLVRVGGEGVVLHTVKLAEDGSGDVVVRLYESLGAPTRAQVRVAASGIVPVDILEQPVDKRVEMTPEGASFDLRAFEVATLRLRMTTAQAG